MRYRILLFSAVCLSLLLGACGTPTSAPQADATLTAPAADAPTLEPGKGAITGKVLSTSERWPGEEVTVYAASFAAVEGGGGMYTLEPYLVPQAVAGADGSFTINNIPPGDYVLVVGPEPARAKLIVDEVDKSRIFNVTAGVLQAGDLTMAR